MKYLIILFFSIPVYAQDVSLCKDGYWYWLQSNSENVDYWAVYQNGNFSGTWLKSAILFDGVKYSQRWGSLDPYKYTSLKGCNNKVGCSDMSNQIICATRTPILPKPTPPMMLSN